MLGETALLWSVACLTRCALWSLRKKREFNSTLRVLLARGVFFEGAVIAGEFYQSPYGPNELERMGSNLQSLVKDSRG